jgi:hypothetical protein
MELTFLAIGQKDIPGGVAPMMRILCHSVLNRKISFLRENLLSLFGPDRAFAGILQFNNLTALFLGAVSSHELYLEPGRPAMLIDRIHDLQSFPQTDEM